MVSSWAPACRGDPCGRPCDRPCGRSWSHPGHAPVGATLAVARGIVVARAFTNPYLRCHRGHPQGVPLQGRPYDRSWVSSWARTCRGDPCGRPLLAVCRTVLRILGTLDRLFHHPIQFALQPCNGVCAILCLTRRSAILYNFYCNSVRIQEDVRPT